MRNSLLMVIASDKRGLAVAGSSLDDLIKANNNAARVQSMLTLVDLPYNMLKDIDEDLLAIYENGEIENEN